MKLERKADIKSFGREKGQSAAEYCIIIALVSVIVLTGAGIFGERTAALFDTPFSSGAASEEEENVEEPPEGSEPLKILGENGNLNFVYGLKENYTVGEEYSDNTGKTAISGIFPFYGDIPFATRKTITTANFDSSFRYFKPVHLIKLFCLCENLSTVTNTHNLKTDNVISMHETFQYTGKNAAAFSIDVSSWNTGKVTDMEYMFQDAGGNKAKSVIITGLDGWDVSSVTTMSYMFDGTGENAEVCDIGDLSGWDTGNVTVMAGMFRTLGRSMKTRFDIGNLGRWNVSCVTDFSGMFDSAGCRAVEWYAGDLSGWDVGKAENMSYMFQSAGCSAKCFSVGDLSGWNVGNAVNMIKMFCNTGASSSIYTLGDISRWNTQSAVNMTDMLFGAFPKADYRLNLCGWKVDNVTCCGNFNGLVEEKMTPPEWMF